MQHPFDAFSPSQRGALGLSVFTRGSVALGEGAVRYPERSSTIACFDAQERLWRVDRSQVKVKIGRRGWVSHDLASTVAEIILIKLIRNQSLPSQEVDGALSKGVDRKKVAATSTCTLQESIHTVIFI